MDTLREKISSALCELVGRKDAAVFQSADNFEKMLQKIGNWPQLPEILALKAGLQERAPWELQKGSSGPVSRSVINSLATNIGRKHQISPALAVWAIESWAFSLGLKIEPEVIKPDVTASSAAKPAIAKPLNDQFGKEIAGNTSGVENARIGIIFGTDASGLIRVFKSWWQPASPAETAGLAATPVKVEKAVGCGLFTAAPRAKKKQASRQPVLPVKPVLVHAADNVAKQSTTMPGQVAAPNVSTKPVVYTGSAEELCAQAQALLPGYGSRVNVQEALEILQQAVKLGSVTARRRIGELYHKGLGVKQDFKMAANWFRLAADSGDVASQFYLGTLYQCGMGVEFNLTIARSWLQKAADQGHVEAKALLIEMLQA